MGDNRDGGNIDDDAGGGGISDGDGDEHNDDGGGNKDGNEGGGEFDNGADGVSGVDDDISDANADDWFGASKNIEHHNNEDSDTDPGIEKLQQELSTAENEFITAPN